MARMDGAAAAAAGMAAGLIGLGALTLAYRDFALVWQPVPAGWPGRPLTPVLSGLILLAAGGLMLGLRTRAWGAALAGAFIGLWVLALHLPHALAKPLVVSSWQAVAESTAVATGAFIAARERWAAAPRLAVYIMGACYVVFGVSHFAYADFTASMVPPWLPDRPAFTWLTGAIHVLAGLSLLTGVQRRWGAVAEALMMSSFVLLVHIPRVAAQPHDRMEQTALAIATILTSAAWTLASSRTLRSRG